MKAYDKIIIGAGLYGLYAARFCGKKGERVLVLEHDSEPFSRATYVNQARVHMGYHYPRSLTTALKSAGYYRRFHQDFSFAIRKDFRQVYATSSEFSWTAAPEFEAFCHAAGIYCEPLSPNAYFQEGMCDGAFLTEEDTYDAMLLKEYFLEELRILPGVEILCGVRLKAVSREEGRYRISFSRNGSLEEAETGFLLNASYASANQVLSLAGADLFGIKYELCEIILCKAGRSLKKLGLTVMDGPFFSIMPFGKTGWHSLTAVTFTPHVTSYEPLPSFPCQEGTSCSPRQLENCSLCPRRPESAWPYMSRLAHKYMKPEHEFQYEKSLYSMKPILKSSEVDDSRPTVIRINSENPKMISVLSGKINTVYDMDEYL
ncbi:MAG: FAD-binding oxidoreductase [Lachnospiraceae bacterium]|nr:FAD-binding oxidoreductase [Lachnospiraceae bacterium]